MSLPQDHLILALDVPTFEEAQQIVEELGDKVQIYKIGSVLFTALGPMIIRYLLAHGKKVFLDLKYHDIPNTVAKAIENAVALSEQVHEVADAPKGNEKNSLFMITIHTQGGEEMLKAAATAAQRKATELEVEKPLILGITVLTSDSNTDNMSTIVKERAALALKSGLDGIVASSLEAKSIREEFGDQLKIITPGIRPQSAASDDQKRVTTPREAISNGSDFLVVGRPILHSPDRKQAAQQILDEIQQALTN